MCRTVFTVYFKAKSLVERTVKFRFFLNKILSGRVMHIEKTILVACTSYAKEFSIIIHALLKNFLNLPSIVTYHQKVL